MSSSGQLFGTEALRYPENSVLFVIADFAIGAVPAIRRNRFVRIVKEVRMLEW